MTNALKTAQADYLRASDAVTKSHADIRALTASANPIGTLNGRLGTGT